MVWKSWMLLECLTCDMLGAQPTFICFPAMLPTTGCTYKFDGSSMIYQG